MTTTRTNVTRRDAEKILASLKTWAGVEPNDPYGPTLRENWDWIGSGNPAPFSIVWEEGPFEWTYRFPGGGFDEELYYLAAEFGEETARRLATKPPVEVPEHVFVENITSWAIGLYPKEEM